MKYKFEDQLFEKLIELDDINSKIKDLTDHKNKIQNQIKEWCKLNNIEDKVIMENDNGRWTITKTVQNKNSIRNYSVLEYHLGDQAPMFINKTQSEVFRINKNR